VRGLKNGWCNQSGRGRLLKKSQNKTTQRRPKKVGGRRTKAKEKRVKKKK